MTLEEIKKRVDRIRKMKSDDESAHYLEDELMKDFIRHIASYGDGNLIEMADAVLETENIDFCRWYA